MDSAFTRLFMIQELGCLVASHLTKKDMSHLMRTSRQMFTVMEPSFYRELNTYNKPKGINLWESPNGLEALTRNIHFVKTWNSDLLFFVYYHRALVAFDDINSTPSSILAQSALSSTETSSTLPQLHFETTQQAFQIVPLPPMTELTTARLFLAHSANNIDRCRYFQPEYIDPKAMTLRLCVILEHLPQLRELDVQDLTIQDSWSTRLFMTTLQKMSELTSLSISLSADTAYSGIVALICSSVQPSIRSLSILELYADENSITSGTALTLPSITATPLVNLRYLRLFKWTERTTEDEIMSIFGRCPNLEDLTVVEALIPDKVRGADISRVCPNLCKISFHWRGVWEDKGLWPLELMATLPQHQVTNVLIQGPPRRISNLSDLEASKAFLRHSQSLREFRMHHAINGAAVGLVLRTCNVLESVAVYGSTLQLEDAVAAPWASSKISHLSLELNVAPPSWPPLVIYTPYYLRNPPTPPTAEENMLFAQLESFYQQIGSLQDMKCLYLGTSHYDEQGKALLLYSVLALPGMLTLADNKMRRPGFLEHLGRWTKLETIGGSIIPETLYGEMPAGAPEVGWILSHWTSLVKCPSSHMF